MGRIEGKTAIITGGAGGIGTAAVKLFAEEGANVLAVDLDEEQLQRATQSAGSNRVSYCVADVTKSEDNQRMVDTAVERYGQVDIFLANAGIEGQVRGLLDYDEETFDRVMAVNVKGVWLGLRSVIPDMLKHGGGSIVITSSVAGLKGGPSITPYVTSKHAVIGLMRSIAKEFARSNIRVNSVNPAPVETRMMRSLEAGMSPGNEDAAKQRIAGTIPLNRYADPREIAQVMLFLSSDDASFITGSVYTADGGDTA